MIKYFSQQTGEPCQSFHPWPLVHTRGGGAVIPCQYHISVKKMKDVDMVLTKVKDAIGQMQEKTVLTINVI